MAFARPLLVATLLAACGHHGSGYTDAAIDGGYVADACEGLGCFQFDCSTKGLPPTTVSGTVYAPNGTLPLYGVDVYVPRQDPGPLPDGAVCARCDQGLQGGSFTAARTDEAGHFVLENVPATANVPIVIQTGKWRRQLTLPLVASCQDHALAATETRLPKDHTEGDIPRIAISTGGADAIECLLLKLGIADAEISNDTGAGRIHLYTDLGVAVPTVAPPASGRGTDRFKAGWAGGSGQSFADSQSLWSSATKLKQYDIVINSCEGGQYPASKPTTSLTTLHDYANLGGRVFLSHWHNVWIEGGGVGTVAPATWVSVATWNNSNTTFNSNPFGTDPPDLIDEVANPKGMSFATWMQNVGGSPANMRGVIPISEGKQTATGVDPMKAERWVYWVDAAMNAYPQDFQFTTPVDVPVEQRCGKVVFSDMHVSSGSLSQAGATYAYPNGCSSAPLSAQEKALAFIFFDIASCVGSIF